MSPEELADAYWTYYELSTSTHREDRLQAEDLVWAWEMTEAIAQTQAWEDQADPRRARRAERVAPAIDRVELIELLAERSTGTDAALAYLGAGPVEGYLHANPDIARVDEVARRSVRFRTALTMARYDSDLPPKDVARLRRFGVPR